jgi:hypothetical protein
MSILVLTSDTLIGTPATGNIEYNGQFFGTDSNASRAQLQRITQGTTQASTSGTSIDFTGLPAWVKKITVMFNGVSTSGTSQPQVQLGDSGGIETTGYVVTGSNIASSAVGSTSVTSGFMFGNTASHTAANTLNGSLILTTLGSNSWVGFGCLATGGDTRMTSGSKTLSDVLDRVRITTVNGTDTFDAGSINILYEG